MATYEPTDKHTEAAQLLASGELTNAEIADKLGVTYQTLWNWKQKEEFAALVEENLARFREEVRRRGIAILERRVKAINDRWNRMQRVIEERAIHPDYAVAPGGKTGLLVKTYKMLGSGPAAERVEEFAVDTGLLRELREHEKQAAQELGQWVEKQSTELAKPKADVGEVLNKLSTDDLAILTSLAEKLAGGSGQPVAEDPGGAGAAVAD